MHASNPLVIYSMSSSQAALDVAIGARKKHKTLSDMGKVPVAAYLNGSVAACTLHCATKRHPQR